MISEHIDNQGTRPAVPEGRQTTAEVIQASRDARLESDAMMEQARIAFEGFTQRNPRLGFSNRPGTPLA